MDRRSLLKSATLPVAFAGCLGLSDTNIEPSPEPENVDQRELTFSARDGISADRGRINSSIPKFYFSDTTTVDGWVEFTTENLETGDQVTIEIDDKASFETDEAGLRMYNAGGTLLHLAPGDFTPRVTVNTGNKFEQLDASVQGDETTFTEIQRATYRTTMYRAGVEVGSTEYEMTVGHEQEFDYTLTEETIEASFNPGSVPTGGSARTILKPADGGRFVHDKGGYDEEADRFVTEIDNPGLPPERRNSLILRIKDPDTDRVAFGFSALIDLSEENQDN